MYDEDRTEDVTGMHVKCSSAAVPALYWWKLYWMDPVWNGFVSSLGRYVQKAVVSSLYDEGKLQVWEQLCFLPSWGERTTTAPKPSCKQAAQPAPAARTVDCRPLVWAPVSPAALRGRLIL